MKGMAGELCSLGKELLDHHLILQLLHGLRKKYDHMKALIKHNKLLPSFHAVRNDLELEELDMEIEADLASATALYTTPSIVDRQQQHAASTTPSAPLPSYAPTDVPLHLAACLLAPTKARTKGREGHGQRCWWWPKI
jgi:hypothetical protein